MVNAVMEKYKRLLSHHDWFYDYSDDHSVWTRGSKERAELMALRENIDPDYKVWNTIAPDMFKVERK